MDYSQLILAVNAASIAILTLFTMLLLASSKFKGMNGYAALVTFVPTVPVYLYNMSRMLSWHGFAHVIMPVAFSVNTTLMPLLWILVRINYDSGYRWDIRKCIHFLPFLACLILILSIGSKQRMEVIEYEPWLPEQIQAQQFFRHVCRCKRPLKDHTAARYAISFQD